MSFNKHWPIIKSTAPKLVPFFKTVAIFFVLYPTKSPTSFVYLLLKCAPIAALCLFVILHGMNLGFEYSYSRRILFGFMFSMIGDAFLVYKEYGKSYFLMGMAAFAIAHIMYFTAFGMKPFNFRLAFLIFLLTTPLTITYVHILPDYILKIMVPLYIVLISSMLWRAFSRLRLFNNNFEWTKLCCSIGAALFAISDFILAYDAFISKLEFSHPLIMVTYYAAQLGIALSIVDSWGNHEVNCRVIKHHDLNIMIDFSVFYRKKKYFQEDLEETKLARVLTLVDLTALGVSCTLGSGIYVLVGDVVVNYAGPSIVLSFLVAGLASFLAGLCYAELGARVPRSGSAYVYIYVTIGEFIAFLIGWDVILEYVIGTSSTSSAMSQYIDSLCGNKIQDFLKRIMPMHVGILGAYPDILSFGITMCITVLLVIGVKESSFLNKIFTLLNLVVILFIIITGALKADFHNWTIDYSTLKNTSWIDYDNKTQTCQTEKCGSGGFFPFGFEGVIKGAAKCFYAFIGFDCIATTGEEVQNPKRSIPLSIVFTLIIVAASYCAVSAVITLMIPYYMLNPNAPFPVAFNYIGFHWATYVVTIGAIASLGTCLYASMFPMPRVVYSMASDGLILKSLSYVSPKLRTPIWAALSTGLFAAIMATLFDLNQLIEMMSIGTLLAYSLVSASVIILRYRPSEESESVPNSSEGEEIDETEESITASNVQLTSAGRNGQTENLLKRLFAPSNKKCNQSAALIVNIVTVLSVIDIITLSLLLSKLPDLTKPYAIALITACLIVLAVLTTIIFRQPQNEKITTFKVPLVPFFPLMAVFINVYLMMILTIETWMRFIVWFVIGFFMYTFYGARNSLENNLPKTIFFPFIKSRTPPTTVDTASPNIQSEQ